MRLNFNTVKYTTTLTICLHQTISACIHGKCNISHDLQACKVTSQIIKIYIRLLHNSFPLIIIDPVVSVISKIATIGVDDGICYNDAYISKERKCD